MRNDCSAHDDVAEQMVRLRAEEGIRRGEGRGKPGAMFPPGCVDNRLCFACARVAFVNGEQEFAGGELAKHVKNIN